MKIGIRANRERAMISPRLHSLQASRLSDASRKVADSQPRQWISPLRLAADKEANLLEIPLDLDGFNLIYLAEADFAQFYFLQV
jgi:hypothetical protein